MPLSGLLQLLCYLSRLFAAGYLPLDYLSKLSSKEVRATAREALGEGGDIPLLYTQTLQSHLAAAMGSIYRGLR